jgi:hypothetical protein
MKKLNAHLRATCVLAGLASITGLSFAQEIPPPTASASSNASRIALVAEGGTAGFGPSLIITANEKFTFTLGYTWLDYDYDVSSEDADYNGKLELSNFKALANWHPWNGAFHFSAGLFATDNEVAVTAKPEPGNVFEVNGVDYPTSQIQSITGTATFEDDIAPYFGVGWAKSPANSGLAFYATLGVFLAGDANARLTATGPQANNAQFQANLRAEENDINDDLGSLGAYPVLQIGIQYRF